MEHREGGKTKSKSKARENLGYEGELETSREPKPEKLKSGKRRRKKLKGVLK